MQIRFLADENIANSVIDSLRKLGFDVKDLKEENLHGLKDSEVLEVAIKENRIIIAHDKDFANLLNYSSRPHRGIILLRFENYSPTNIIEKLIPILKSDLKRKLKNSIITITDHYIEIFEDK